MFNFFTPRNKKDLVVYPLVSILAAAVFLACARIGWHSFVHYENKIVAGISKSQTQASRFSSTPVTDRLVVVIIDGLSYEDCLKMSYVKKYSPFGSFGSMRVLEPTLSMTSWATITTGAPPGIHSMTDPSPDFRKNYPLIENFVSMARRRTLTTAIFGYKYWELSYSEFADILYTKDFAKDDSDIVTIDDDIMSNALSFLRNRRPELTIIHLPGLDRTSHRYGKKDRQFAIHLEKVDSLINAFLRSAMTANTYAIIMSDHGHIETGGHGGGESEVITAPVFLFGPDVVPDGMKNFILRQVDICPTVCALLGLPFPYFNQGSFASELFSFPSYLKCDKASKNVLQKSIFYSAYVSRLGQSVPKIFNAAAALAEIESASPAPHYQKRLASIESYEREMDSAFAAATQDSLSRDRLYRFVYVSLPAFAFLFFIFFRYRRKYQFFSAFSLCVIFYCIYYGLFFGHGYGFSLSDVNSAELMGAFLSGRRIEAAAALLLSAIPLLLNYFVYQKRLFTWLNYVFIPIFIEFNYLLTFSLTIQILYYIGEWGVGPDCVLPEMKAALKYYLDIQVLAVSQAVSFAVLALCAIVLRSVMGKAEEKSFPEE